MPIFFLVLVYVYIFYGGLQVRPLLLIVVIIEMYGDNIHVLIVHLLRKYELYCIKLYVFYSCPDILAELFIIT